jgi:hypothetical protein
MNNKKYFVVFLFSNHKTTSSTMLKMSFEAESDGTVAHGYNTNTWKAEIWRMLEAGHEQIC